MSIIRFTCGNCGKAIEVDGQFIGRQGKCPQCQTPFTVPTVSIASESPSPDLLGIADAVMASSKTESPVAALFLSPPLPPPPPNAGAHSGGESTNGPKLLQDPNVLARLRKHKKLRNCTCLECGYSGLVGFIGESRPWYASGWLVYPPLILVCLLTPIGWPFILCVVGFALWRGSGTKTYLECPNCGKTLMVR